MSQAEIRDTAAKLMLMSEYTDAQYAYMSRLWLSVHLQDVEREVMDACVRMVLTEKSSLVRMCMLMPTMCACIPTKETDRGASARVFETVYDFWAERYKFGITQDIFLPLLYLVEFGLVSRAEKAPELYVNLAVYVDEFFSNKKPDHPRLRSAWAVRLARCSVLYALGPSPSKDPSPTKRQRYEETDPKLLWPRVVHRAIEMHAPETETMVREYVHSLMDSVTRTLPKPSLDDYAPNAVYPIGSGAFGNVFLVYRDGDARALKRMEITEDNARTIVRERNLLMLLRHPNLMEGRRLFVEGTSAYVEMEYAPFGVMSDHEIDRDATSDAQIQFFIKRAYLVASQLIPAVEFLHAHDIVHSDIKPNNVAVFDRGRTLKLMDFGLCTKVDETESKGLFGSKIWNNWRVYKSTYAPETTVDEGVGRHPKEDIRGMDIWALGQFFFKGQMSHDQDNYGMLRDWFSRNRMGFGGVRTMPLDGVYGSADPDLIQAIRAMVAPRDRSFAAMKAWVERHEAEHRGFGLAAKPFIAGDQMSVADVRRMFRSPAPFPTAVRLQNLTFDETSDVIEFMDPTMRHELIELL